MNKLAFLTFPSPTIDANKLLDEQIDLAIRNYLYTALGNLFTSILLYFALHTFEHTNPDYLLGWLISQILLCGTWTWVYFRHYPDYQAIRNRWEWQIEIPTSFWAGLNWGLAWALFISPTDLYSAFFLNTVICGIVFGIVVANPLNQRVMLMGLVPCLLPVIIRAFWIGTFLFNWIGVIAIGFLIAAYAFGVNIQSLHLKMFQQREENARLAFELELEKQQVEKISQEKTRFLAAASHDLRQPIQAMRLFEGALASLLTTPLQKNILNKISESGAALSSLLESLLDISRLDSGALKTEPVLIDLETIFYHLYQQYADLADAEGIELRYASTSSKAYIDPNQLERILSNLLNNAIKYMGRPGKILLGVRHVQGNLRLEIWDNGQGIPVAEQEKVFEEFYQIDNPERNRNKGLGLGLPIVKRLSKLTGCQLAFQSIPNKGCYFSLYLPRIPEVIQDNLPALTPTIKDTSEPVLFSQSYSVLILEDDQTVALALYTLLTSWGLHVQTATNRASALATLHQATPQLILADYQLTHGELGTEVIKHICTQLEYAIPAIILTGNTDPAVVKVLNQIDYPVIYKPIQANVLQELICEQLDQKQIA